MTNIRRHLLIGLALVGQTGIAGAQDCYYGAGKYTSGTILCQSGTRMQCALDAEGQATWRSLDEQCTDFMDTPILPVESHGATGQIPKVTAGAGAKNPDTNPAPSSTPVQAAGVSAEEIARAKHAGRLTIEILWADYGRDGRNCDAAATVTERCSGESACSIDVDTGTLCAEDPFPGRKKLLSVYWKCRNSVEDQPMPPLYGQDGERVELTCN